MKHWQKQQFESGLTADRRRRLETAPPVTYATRRIATERPGFGGGIME